VTETGDPFIDQLRRQASDGAFRLTLHMHQEMVEEAISLDDVLDAVASGTVLEDYPDHRRGGCCLVAGVTRAGRPLHLICSTTLPVLVMITVYEPKPPKWLTPTKRGQPT